MQVNIGMKYKNAARKEEDVEEWVREGRERERGGV